MTKEEREEAIEQLKWYFEYDNGLSADKETVEAYKMAIKALEQEPKTGHWEYYRNNKGDWVNECSVCGLDAGVGYPYPYCPHCGARMIESEE